jgi:hypothetical protein
MTESFTKKYLVASVATLVLALGVGGAVAASNSSPQGDDQPQQERGPLHPRT